MAKELNLDESLPQPLEYVSGSEIYVFFGEDIPPHRDVRLELPPFIKKTADHTQKKKLSKSFGETQQSVSSTVLIGLLLLFVIIVIWLQTR
ncbi:MAG: hypothetical protein HWE22_07655 [Flavobacteriales bacterium]|nr:hypothetical protein [Flavobacteriales bacterium]